MARVVVQASTGPKMVASPGVPRTSTACLVGPATGMPVDQLTGKEVRLVLVAVELVHRVGMFRSPPPFPTASLGVVAQEKRSTFLEHPFSMLEVEAERRPSPDLARHADKVVLAEGAWARAPRAVVLS